MGQVPSTVPRKELATRDVVSHIWEQTYSINFAILVGSRCSHIHYIVIACLPKIQNSLLCELGLDSLYLDATILIAPEFESSVSLLAYFYEKKICIYYNQSIEI